MLVRGVVDDQVDDYTDPALPRSLSELDEVAKGAIAGVDAVVVGDVVASSRRAKAGRASARGS